MASRSALRLNFLSFVACILLLPAAACSGGEVYHSFEYGSAGGDENVGVEILNYQYGDSRFPETYELGKGHIGQGGGVTGEMPVGDFLYVKWKVLATGKIYEDRVNLKGRLPDMQYKRLHFAVKGSQLYIYVVKDEVRAKNAPDCLLHLYKYDQCTMIYPEYWTNF